MGAKVLVSAEKPDVYTFHDIREYLAAMFDYIKTYDAEFSLRRLAMKAGLSSGLIPSVMARKITLTKSTLGKICARLPMAGQELIFAEWLRLLSESTEQSARKKAYKNICRHGRYQGKNSTIIEAHKYLEKWYFPAIRELAKWPDFKADPKWIRKRLESRITASQARDALKFLIDHGYIQIDAAGATSVPEKQITCAGGVYKLAMSDYHEQVLNLAIRSIYETKPDNRDLNIHTFSFRKDQFHLVKDIFSEALTKLQKINESVASSDSVYQACMLSFPVAADQQKGGKK